MYDKNSKQVKRKFDNNIFLQTKHQTSKIISLISISKKMQQKLFSSYSTTVLLSVQIQFS